MSDNRDATQARIRQDEASAAVTGEDPRKSGGGDARAQQRFIIASFVKQIFDAQFDPLLIVEQLLAGAAFIGDNVGVSRQQMAAFVTTCSIMDQRQLVFTIKQ